MEVKIKPKDKPYYVSNPRLFQVYVDWYKELKDAEQNSTKEPEMPRYIAESIVNICTKLSYKPNFINYSYRDEMIGDAIENCIRTVRNFNPDRSNNPFSFITTIAWNAFLRRIAYEKKQTYIKGKLIEEMPLDELVDIQDHDVDTLQQHAQFLEFIRENSYIVGSELPGAKGVGLHEESLENFMGGDHE